jgi:hypothetical protein
MLRDCSLDDLREQFHKIRLTSLGGAHPAQLPFANVIEKQQNGTQAILALAAGTTGLEQLESITGSLHCQMESIPLPLEDIYSLVIEEEKRRARGEA